MKVAISKGTLRIPPTYFAVEHALGMEDIDWHIFTLVSDIQDPSIKLPVTQSTDFSNKKTRAFKERIKLFCLRRMSRQITEWNPDIIHQHQATWSLPAISAHQRTGAPLIATLHGSDAYRIQHRKLSLISQLGNWWSHSNRTYLFSHADLLLAVSKYLAGAALRSGAPHARLDVHYQGVDTDFWTPSDAPLQAQHSLVYPGQLDTPHLLFVGALTQLKGVADLLAVSEKVADTFPHTLEIIGGGPLQPLIEEYSHRHSHITFRGPLPRIAVRESMRRASALIHPTREFSGIKEAAGLVLLEAQSCGTPVITNDVGGTSEMLLNGETGFLTKDDSPDSLAQAITHFLFMPNDEKISMGERARDWVIKHRSLSRSITELRAVYESLT